MIFHMVVKFKGMSFFQKIRPGNFFAATSLITLIAFLFVFTQAARGRAEQGSPHRPSPAPFLEERLRGPEITFLNDRASSVVGATPLAAPGFVRPEGLTGASQVVAIADSGLGNGRMDEPHPDLKSRPGQMPKVIMLKSWAGRQTAEDPTGHGTHLAATVAGTGAASGGQFAGVAPGASIYFQAILDPEGRPAPPADLAALFKPAYAAAARIHLNGWGTKGNAYSAAAAQVDAFVRAHPDFLVVFGAGNDGPQPGTLTNEANSKNALVVGASEGVRPAFGPGEDNAFEVARFSSRGPAADGRQKPDLVAPGSGIISAAAPAVKSNFPPNPLYTRMQGTSQAAAVAAGAAALLREYLQKEEKLASPSAALLKAALINGARPIPGDGAGFGRLDLAATVIAFKEKLFSYADERNPLAQGETRLYRYTVRDRSEPFTATLVWTDPPAAPGAAKTLVNDLDLVVTAPDGKKYAAKDHQNNAERVVVPYPEPGVYTVEVKATALAGAQDYALVFGQPPAREVVEESSQGKIRFTSGKEMAVPATVKTALGRYLAPAEPRHIFPGEDAYVAGDQNLYLAGAVWRAQAAQNLPLSWGTLLCEAAFERREGGFYLHPRVTVLANGQKTDGVDSLPAGVPAAALVNPSTQMVWWMKTDYLTKDGILKEIDVEKGRLSLFGEEQTHTLDPGVAFSFSDTAVNGSLADLPFGAPAAGTIDQLAPGMPVRLVISPRERRVVYVAARRQLAVGEIKSVDHRAETITLEEGSSYRVITGAPVTVNGHAARFADLKPGLHAALLLAGDTVIGIQADSAVAYGQVVYFAAAENRLYFLDCHNRMQTLALSPEVKFFRWWQPGDVHSLLPGEWARLVLDPQSGKVTRLDVADAQPEQSGTLAFYDPARRLAAFSPQGAGPVTALVTARTSVTKNGYPVQIEDLLPGEKVAFTLLRVPKSEDKILAAVKGETSPGVRAPLLQASCRSRGEQILVQGITEGEHVYIYTEDGQAVKTQPGAGGGFSLTLPRPGGKTLQVVTVERRSGGVAGMYLTIPEAPEAAVPEPPAQPEPAVFSDVAGHPAQKEIAALAAQGVLKGYPDGTFRPDRQVTRAEFTAMLVRALELNRRAPGSPAPEQPAFSDELPAWAAGDISLAARYGLVSGYPDGAFRADRPLTGLEAVCILARLVQKEKDQDLSRSGFLPGYPNGRLHPYTGFTRAEAALIIYQVRKIYAR